MFRRYDHNLFCVKTIFILSLLSLVCACSEEPQSKDHVRPVIVTVPQSADEVTDVYPGQVVPQIAPELAFRVSGKMVKRLVDTGAQVSSGQPLAELDAADTHLAIQAREAQLSAASSRLQQLKGERDRYNTLHQKKMVSHSQFEQFEQQYQTATAQMKQAQSELELSRNQSKYVVLKSPEAGVIASRLAEVGQIVAAGQPIFQLAANRGRDILIHVPESKIHLFKPSVPVGVELWTQAEKVYTAHVREVSPMADTATRTYAVRVGLDASVAVDLGQTAKVFFSEEGKGLLVPMTSVTAENQKPFVWVVDHQSHKVARRSVSVSSYGRNNAVLVSGVNQSDWVVASGGYLLKDGQQVRPVDSNNKSMTMHNEQRP